MRVATTLFVLMFAGCASTQADKTVSTQNINPRNVVCVQPTIYRGTTLIAEPTLIVEEGKPAHMNQTGENPWAIVATAAKLESDRAVIDLQYSDSNGAISPSLIVRYGQPAEFTQAPYRIRLTANRCKA